MSRAEGYLPTFHDKTWCPQGHVMPATAPACPTCRNAIAVVMSDLRDQLDLGLLPALDPDPVIGRETALPATVERYRAGLIDDAELMR